MNLLLHKLSGISEAWKTVEQSEKVTLLTHIRPDGDGISACAAFEAVLLTMGKQVETIYPSEPEVPLNRQPQTRLLSHHKQTPDLIVTFDTAVKTRVYWHDSFDSVPMMVVDHHLEGDLVGQHQFMLPLATSTCELLYTLLMQWKPESISPYVAECLMYGLLYDTMVFRTNHTTTTCLRVAAELMEKGASLYDIKGELLRPFDPMVIQLWGTALAAIVTDATQKVSWIMLTTEMLRSRGLDNSAVGPLSNIFAELCATDVTILFYEQDGTSKASMRSKSTDVASVAKKVGGGGHRMAAGASSEELDLDQFKDKILSLLQ